MICNPRRIGPNKNFDDEDETPSWNSDRMQLLACVASRVWASGQKARLGHFTARLNFWRLSVDDGVDTKHHVYRQRDNSNSRVHGPDHDPKRCKTAL